MAPALSLPVGFDLLGNYPIAPNTFSRISVDWCHWIGAALNQTGPSSAKYDKCYPHKHPEFLFSHYLIADLVGNHYQYIFLKVR